MHLAFAVGTQARKVQPGKVNALFAARAQNAHIPLACGVLFAGRLKAGRLFICAEIVGSDGDRLALCIYKALGIKAHLCVLASLALGQKLIFALQKPNALCALFHGLRHTALRGAAGH